jgi:hypothetical protein
MRRKQDAAIRPGRQAGEYAGLRSGGVGKPVARKSTRREIVHDPIDHPEIARLAHGSKGNELPENFLGLERVYHRHPWSVES